MNLKFFAKLYVFRREKGLQTLIGISKGPSDAKGH